MNKGFSGTLLGLSCLLLSSCALNESSYHNDLAVPHSYGQVASSKVNPSAQILPLDFYRSYGDLKLNALIERALAYNHDINSAYLNLKQAQVDYALANSALHPTGTASLSSKVSKDLSTSSDSVRSSGASLGISYELDLFGRLDAASKVGLEQFTASAYDYQAMRLAVIKSTSEYYWNYAYAQEALDLAQEQLDASYKRLKLIKEKQLQGASDGLEYDQALVNHKNVEQALYQKSYELTSAQNALSTILGYFSEHDLSSEVADQALESTICPQVPVSLPANLLKQRPDLMAYEARVRAAFAKVDEAQASFYPSFNLNASLSSGSVSTLARFLSDPIGALGAAITFPFINYNQLSLQEESSLIARDRAKLDFANGFRQAVQEVSDSLNNLHYQEQLIESTHHEYQLTVKNYERYAERYRYGSASLSELLDASDSLRSAQNKLLQAKLKLLSASMTLMVAMGGSYHNNPEQVLDQAQATSALIDKS